MLHHLPDQAHDHDPSAGQHPQGQHLPAPQEAAPGDPKVVELLATEVRYRVDARWPRKKGWLKGYAVLTSLEGARLHARQRETTPPVQKTRIVRETTTREVIE